MNLEKGELKFYKWQRYSNDFHKRTVKLRDLSHNVRGCPLMEEIIHVLKITAQPDNEIL